jgi:glycosyltransferase involved in cell wall biosynthesis
MKVAVIGLRAYPSNFAGTSGVEVYGEKILEQFKNNSRISFIVYTKSSYQQNTSHSTTKRILVIPVKTVSSKVLETVICSCWSSWLAAFSDATVIWYHGTGPALFSFLPKLRGKRIILTVHSLDWKRKKWSFVEKKLFSMLTVFVLRMQNETTVVSLKLKKFLSQNYQIQSTYVPPGLSATNSRLTQKQITNVLKKFNLKPHKYILFLGRIVPEKRPDWLLQAFSEISKKFPAHELVIAGGHGNLPAFEEELKSNYKNKRIHWLGYVFGKEKEVLLSECSCFVLPSELEGNSVSLIEAISIQKKSLISSDVLQPGFESLAFINTFPTQNYQLFKRSLVKLLSQKNKQVKSNTKLDKILSVYSWKKTAQTYLNLFSI